MCSSDLFNEFAVNCLPSSRTAVIETDVTVSAAQPIVHRQLGSEFLTVTIVERITWDLEIRKDNVNYLL